MWFSSKEKIYHHKKVLVLPVSTFNPKQLLAVQQEHTKEWSLRERIVSEVAPRSYEVQLENVRILRRSRMFLRHLHPLPNASYGIRNTDKLGKSRLSEENGSPDSEDASGSNQTAEEGEDNGVKIYTLENGGILRGNRNFLRHLHPIPITSNGIRNKNSLGKSLLSEGNGGPESEEASGSNQTAEEGVDKGSQEKYSAYGRLL